ncbi:MAG TPA: hypothetical protein VHB77_04340 [Planctomycetaceae bacterium]|nr:hypothetical protein [Planctomycetaceae bacterium]
MNFSTAQAFRRLLTAGAIVAGAWNPLAAIAEESDPLYETTDAEELFDSHLLADAADADAPGVAQFGKPNCCPTTPGACPTSAGWYYDANGNLCPQPGTSSQEPSTASPYDSSNAPNTMNNNLGNLNPGQGALTASNSVAGSLSGGGYLDPAAPMTSFRLRFEDAVNSNFPDRGEYFYAKCGCFRFAPGNLNDPNAKGPQGTNRSVNYQDIRPYFEKAWSTRFSTFVELAVRSDQFTPAAGATFVGPNAQLGTTSGFADMNLGFKYAIIAEPDQYFTFQWRTYLPTGDSFKGLGTHHVSFEPSLLYYKRLSDRWIFQAQLTEFTPVGVSSFASDVVQYGAGVGYWAYRSDCLGIMPMLETMGWTFLNGQQFSPYSGLSSARGDTIFNVKPGVRVGIGPANGPMMFQRNSIYAGFGIPITGDKFYSNIFRLEYRYVY